MRKMKPISLKSFSTLVTVVCLTCAVLFAGASLGLYQLVNRADREIRLYERDSDPAVVALTEVVGELGFGGFIHAFKNYLLRGGDELRIFDQSAGAIRVNLDKLEQELGPAYGADIDAIRSVINAYSAQVDVIRDIRRIDTDVEAIDRAVAVDDRHAAAALLALRHTLVDDGPGTKSKVLFEVQSALGYAGMIHHFKNYVLRKSPDFEARARASADRAAAALDSYRAFGVNSVEQAALDDLGAVIAEFRSNIDIVHRMIGEGATATQIDEVVLVPQGPALEAFQTLGEQIRVETRAQMAHLHETMDLLQFGAIAMAFLVCAGVVLFSLGLHWVIERVAVRPAAAIAAGLAQLAKGETHVDLSAYANDTEIGRIARASRQFREALVDNIRKGEDLRGLSLERDGMLREHARMVAERAEYTTRRAQLEAIRADEQDEVQTLRNAIVDVCEKLRHGIFTFRIDEDYDTVLLGSLAKDINRLLGRIDETFSARAVGKVGPDDTALDDAQRHTADMMRQTMALALQTLNEAIEEVQRGAAMIQMDRA